MSNLARRAPTFGVDLAGAPVVPIDDLPPGIYWTPQTSALTDRTCGPGQRFVIFDGMTFSGARGACVIVAASAPDDAAVRRILGRAVNVCRDELYRGVARGDA